MKKSLLCVSMVLFFIAGFFWINSKSLKRSYNKFFSKNIIHKNKDKNEKENKVLPYEEFMHARTFPNSVFDDKGFYQTAAQFKRLEELQERDSRLWTLEGPKNIGGRINTIAVHPSNSNIIMVGTTLGGIYKTTNNGSTWYPVFDQNIHLSVSSIVYDRNNPNVVWAGSGDKNMGGNSYNGNGIYKSTDGGETWMYKGLANAKTINDIIIHPSNSNIIFAATFGNPFAYDAERGLYKSTDGGNTWTKILYVDMETAVADIAMHPTNPNILLASTWRRTRVWGTNSSSGTSSGIYRTTDGGATWVKLSTANGLPSGSLSRIGVAFAPSNGNICYAAIIGSDYYLEGFYKSTDAGSNFTKMPEDSNVSLDYAGFGWYFSRFEINPNNENDVMLFNVGLYRTLNGGNTWQSVVPDWSTYEVHADKHDLKWVNNNTMILATDGGLYKTSDNASSWVDFDDIPNTQYYHATPLVHDAGLYMGGAQDNGFSIGNSSNINSWLRIPFGDGFNAEVDPYNSDLVYIESQFGNFGTFENSTEMVNYIPSAIGDRIPWDVPLIASRHFQNVLYCGTNYVSAITDPLSGTSWWQMSDEITDPDPSGNTRFHIISCLSEPELSSDFLLAGCSDGNIAKINTNGGAHTSIDNGLPTLYATAIKCSPNNINNFYVTFSGYRYNSETPRVYKSVNQGQTWTAINGNLPNGAINDILIEKNNENHLFVATDFGVYETLDGGVNWTRMGSNLPYVPCTEIAFNTPLNRLMVATFGRGIHSISLQQTVGINEIATKSTLQIYPTFARNEILLKGIDLEDIKAEVYDISGKIVLQKHIYNHQHSIDISSLNRGKYFIRFYNNKAINIGTSTFIKQ